MSTVQENIHTVFECTEHAQRQNGIKTEFVLNTCSGILNQEREFRSSIKTKTLWASSETVILLTNKIDKNRISTPYSSD